MDVVCVVRRSFPGPGGIATMLRTVAGGISAEGHGVRVVAARIDDAPVSRLNATLTPQRFEARTLEGVTVMPAPAGPAVLASALPMAAATVPGLRGALYGPMRALTARTYPAAAGRALARMVGSADLLHAWGGEHLPWATAHAADALGAPLVVTPFAHPGAWGDDELNAAFYRRADAVLCLVPSEATLYEGMGVAASRIHVVGVPVTERPEPQVDVRRAHAIGDSPLVLYLGVKAAYKGYRTLLSAAAEIWRAVPSARVAFVGPRTAESRSDLTGADERIIEVPEVSDAEVTAWLRAADVLCLPSTSEILPVTILDAWSQGVPVVAGRWWCAPDLVSDGEDGVLVEAEPGPVATAISKLLSEKEMARALGAAGRAKVRERYTPSAVVARHLDAYEAVTSPG